MYRIYTVLIPYIYGMYKKGERSRDRGATFNLISFKINIKSDLRAISGQVFLPDSA